MKSAEQLQDIFDREIERLNDKSKENSLDAADLAKLDRLVSAFSKFKAQNFKDPEDEFSKLTTEELLKKAK